MLKVKRIIDLSLLISNRTRGFPGDPAPKLTVAATLEKDGYNAHNLSLGTHTGTHMDAPFHFLKDGATVEQMDLTLFLGPAVIVDVAGKTEEEEITTADIEPYIDKIKAGDIVLLRTDWYKKEGSDEFYRHPYLSEAAGRRLFDRGVRTVGIDALNIDKTGGTVFPNHGLYLGNGGTIVENLAYLDRVDFERPFLMLLPLKLAGCDGSPIRAAAVEFDHPAET